METIKFMPLVDDLINDDNYYVHHTALRRGYILRKIDGVMDEYQGRFGSVHKGMHKTS